MHVVGHCLAPSVELVSVDEASREGVILLELEVARSLVITKHASNGQVFRPSIEDHSHRLTLGRTHIESSEIDRIVFTVQRNLQLQVITHVFT